MSISHSLLCRIASTLHYMMMWSVFFLHLLTSFYYFHSKFFIEVASCIPGSAVWAAGSWKFSPFEACDRKFQSLIRNIKFKKQEAVENRIANIVCTYIYLHVCICVSKTMNINCYKLLERERQASTAWQYSIFPAERKVHTRHTRFRWVWWVWHVLEVDVFFFFWLSMSRFWSIEDCLNLFHIIECYWMSLTQIDSPVTMTMKKVSFRLILLESLSFGGNSTETPFLPVSGGQTMLRHVDMDRSRRSHRLSRCGTWVCPCMSRYVHVDFVKGSLVEKLPSHGVSPPPPPPHHIITTSHLISPHHIRTSRHINA